MVKLIGSDHRYLRLAMLLLSAAFLCHPVDLSAQETIASPPESATSSPSPVTPAGSSQSIEEKRYLIGPGDVLDIRVFGYPQLARDSVRVDDRGRIRMPLLENDIQASCRTERELAADIATGYLKYVRRPQVDVFVRDYNSEPVAVVGAVHNPGRFQLQRRIHLLELLTFAGGPAQAAGSSVQIVHSQTAPSCDGPLTTSPISTFDLNEVLAGKKESNPYVRAGDVVSIIEAEQVFVVGNVIRPSSIPLRGQLRVSQAIAMAGGVSSYTKTDQVRIIRQLPEGTKQEIFVDLRAIEKKKADDVALQANDIIDVPVSGSKRLLGSLVGSVGPTITQMPIRVIP